MNPLPEAERDGNEGLAGHLNVVWMEDFEAGRTELRYYLDTGAGDVVHLKGFERMVARGQDPALLAGRRVKIRGKRDVEGEILVEAVEWSSRSVALHAVEEQSGSNPHVNLLCKFSDSEATPFTVGEVEDLFASTSPGMDHFWSAISYGIFDLSGSTAHGWYTLPHPQGHYHHENGDFKPVELLEDCTAAADDDVHFPSFSGINLFFNEDIGNTYSTVGTWTLTLEDGVERRYGVLWMPPWANHARVAHGIGHTFGLLHSGTESGGEFANLYDLMSADPCAAPGSGLYSFVGHHMIAEYKRRLGWLGGDRVHQASGVLVEDILLERLATPAGGGPLAVEIPTATDRYYTLENRQVVEYDEGLGCREPGVVLHVVDAGNTWWLKNDAGSDRLAFQPGESFRLEDAGVEVRVGADDGSQIQVSIHPAGPTEIPQNLTAQRVDSSRIQLAWEMPDGALGHSEFRIFRREGSSGPFVYIRRVLGDKSSFVDSGLAERTRYEYIIRACNFETCSQHSNRAWASTAPPIAPPSDVAASAIDHSRIHLTWDHSDPPDAFTEFRIFRRAEGETTFTYVRRVLSDKRSWVDSALEPSTGYEYFLRACDSDAGICSSASSVVSTETAAAIDPPEDVAAQTVDSSRIQLTWDHPGSSTVAPTEYRIFRRTGAGEYAFVRRVLADKDSYVDSGLSPATEYGYFLRACTSEQCSLPSNETAATTAP